MRAAGVLQGFYKVFYGGVRELLQVECLTLRLGQSEARSADKSTPEGKTPRSADSHRRRPRSRSRASSGFGTATGTWSWYRGVGPRKAHNTA